MEWCVILVSERRHRNDSNALIVNYLGVYVLLHSGRPPWLLDAGPQERRLLGRFEMPIGSISGMFQTHSPPAKG